MLFTVRFTLKVLMRPFGGGSGPTRASAT